MPTAFLLRFQEECLTEDFGNVQCATRTYTKIHQEGVDADPGGENFTAVPPLMMGTATKTSIDKEAADADPTHDQARAVPFAKLVAGTQTVTRVHAEAADEDRHHATSRVIPGLYD